MSQHELYEVIDLKNYLIGKQERRIRLLEEKMMELRRKYFRLKYKDESMEGHILEIRKY